LALRSLRLGRLAPDDVVIRHSQVRWLKGNGEYCRPHDVLGFCNMGHFEAADRLSSSDPFVAEAEGVQIALATPVAGHLRREISYGGSLDLIDQIHVWSPDVVVGAIETADASDLPIDVELLLTAGRRRTDMPDQRFSLLGGWHDRTRAWWADGDGEFGTIIAFGFCQLLGMVRGARRTFFELFEAIPGPAHVVYGGTSPFTPSVGLLLEQLRRTPAQTAAIVEDLMSAVAGDGRPNPAELIYAATMIGGITSCLLGETYPLLTRSGYRRSGPPEAVLLSVFADSAFVYRHKTLGYRIDMPTWQAAAAGPRIRAWVERCFERERRDLDDVRADYLALIDEMRARAPADRPTKFMIMNGFSTSAHEDLQSYAAFDAPMGDTLETIHDKDAGLMLCDLAQAKDVAILDFDSIAAEMGAHSHLPDGAHPSLALLDEGRREILRILRDQKIPGFMGARA
jgi:hypothetical protein